jgi:hypothetical protein
MQGVKKLGLLVLILCSCGELNFSPAPCYDSAGHEVACPVDAGGSDGSTADTDSARLDAGVDESGPADASGGASF